MNALRQVKRHHELEAEFLSDMGGKPGYTGKEVLDWLGFSVRSH